MEWFQYKPGIGVESEHVAHRAAPVNDAGFIKSWCRRKFRIDAVEETSNPTKPPTTGKAPPGAPCVQCVLLSIAASDGDESTQSRPTMAEDWTLAGILRKAQWLLDDAAHYLPEGRCSADDCESLAMTLNQLAAAVREHALRVIVIDQSDD